MHRYRWSMRDRIYSVWIWLIRWRVLNAVARVIDSFDALYERAEGRPFLRGWMDEVNRVVLRPLVRLVWGDE